MHIKIDNREYVTTSRAWWLDVAIESARGPVVARINAQSPTLRYPSDEQMAADPDLNRYWGDAANTGRQVSYMIDLTEADIASLGITPGILDFPEIVDGARPTSNRSAKPITQLRHQQCMDWLQNDCIGKPGDY